MNRYNVTIKNIATRMFWASVWLANVATILGWTYIAVYYWGSN